MSKIPQDIENRYNGIVGSKHWIRTLLGSCIRFGEFIQKHGKAEPDETTLKRWGSVIQKDCRDIVEYFEKNNCLLIDNQQEQLSEKDAVIAKERAENERLRELLKKQVMLYAAKDASQWTTDALRIEEHENKYLDNYCNKNNITL